LRAVAAALERNARAKLNAPSESRGGWTIQREVLDLARLSGEQVGDTPFAENVMAERDAIPPSSRRVSLEIS
jgi:hypothetical protein